MLARFIVALILLLLVALAACANPRGSSSLGVRPAAAIRTPTPQPASDEEAIRQLILLEGQGLVSQDIEGLMGLWAPDAVVTDAKHTPANSDDDARWRGLDAIRERYVVLVFPGNPTTAEAKDIQIVIDGDRAIATSTTNIGGETAQGGDRWAFIKRDGRWWITELTYNLEP